MPQALLVRSGVGLSVAIDARGRTERPSVSEARVKFTPCEPGRVCVGVGYPCPGDVVQATAPLSAGGSAVRAVIVQLACRPVVVSDQASDESRTAAGASTTAFALSPRLRRSSSVNIPSPGRAASPTERPTPSPGQISLRRVAPPAGGPEETSGARTTGRLAGAVGTDRYWVSPSSAVRKAWRRSANTSLSSPATM